MKLALKNTSRPNGALEGKEEIQFKNIYGHAKNTVEFQ